MTPLQILVVLLSSFVHGFAVHRPIVPHRGCTTILETWHTRTPETRALAAEVRASGVVLTESRREQTPATINPVLRPKIDKLQDEKDFRNFLDEDDRLCIIKFYAPNCKSCQKFGVQFNRIGKEIGDLTANAKDGSETGTVLRKGDIRLAEMEYGPNKELCKNLGVTKLPTVHFYSKRRLVEGFPCGPRKITMLLEKLLRYRSMTASELAFEAEMNEGMKLGNIVLETLDMDVSSREVKASIPAGIC